MPRPAPDHDGPRPSPGSGAAAQLSKGDLQDMLSTFLEKERQERWHLAESQQGILQTLVDGLASLREHLDKTMQSPQQGMKAMASLENSLQSPQQALSLNSTCCADPCRPSVPNFSPSGDDEVVLALEQAKTPSFVRLPSRELPRLDAISSGGSNKSKAITYNKNGVSHCHSSASIEKRARCISGYRKLDQIVSNNKFTFLTSVVVLIHTIWMGYSVDRELREAHTQIGQQRERYSSSYNMIVEAVFLLFYALEMTLKIVAWGYSYFLGHERLWNWFDFILVVTGVFDFINVTDINLVYLRVLRYIKQVVKALRVLRVVRQFKDLRVIILSMASAFVTFLWAMVAVMVILYMWAILFMHGVIDHLVALPADVDQDELDSLIFYWGSLDSTMLTEYKAVTGGEPWGKAGEALLEVGVFYYYLFLAYVALLAVAVLRMITGIFVQDAKGAAEAEQAETLVENLKVLFREMDQDGSGVITTHEFGESLKSEVAAKLFRDLHIVPSDAEKLFGMLDVDGNDDIDLDEFIGGCKNFSGTAKSIDMAVAMKSIVDLETSLSILMDHVEECFQRHDKAAGIKGSRSIASRMKSRSNLGKAFGINLKKGGIEHKIITANAKYDSVVSPR